jgi:hypothetical protein
MQKSTTLYLLVLSIACSAGIANSKPVFPGIESTIAASPSGQKDKVNWIDNFRKFRTAVYQGDKATVKSFFTFPVTNSNNEIWYLIYAGNEKLEKKLTNKAKPFTGQDFDKYYDKLFSKQFITCIQKIKTDELYKKGETETVEFNNGKDVTYKMIATFDKKSRVLNLNLASNTVIKDANGEVLDGGEFNVVYLFKITDSGQLRFTGLAIAG